MFLAQFESIDALKYVFAYARIVAMCLTLPKLVTDKYFFFYRLLLALVLTIVITPLASSNQTMSITKDFDLASVLIAEVGIGLCLGLAASCVIIGMTAAGQITSQLLGFQIGSLQQGQNVEQTSDYRKMFLVAGVFLWFSVSGHRIAVQGLLSSFEQFPIGHFHFSRELLSLVNQLISVSLEFAVRFSLPVLAVAIVGFIVAGFSSRVIGSSQTTSAAFGFNQLLFFLIATPLIFVLSNETYEQATLQIESVLTALTNIQIK